MAWGYGTTYYGTTSTTSPFITHDNYYYPYTSKQTVSHFTVKCDVPLVEHGSHINVCPNCNEIPRYYQYHSSPSYLSFNIKHRFTCCEFNMDFYDTFEQAISRWNDLTNPNKYIRKDIREIYNNWEDTAGYKFETFE